MPELITSHTVKSLDPTLKVSVPGTPRPQGSMTPIKAAMSDRVFNKYPRTTVEHRNLAVAIIARKWRGRSPLTGAVLVRVAHRFARPTSHFGTGRNAGKVKRSSPVHHTRTPDLDKLQRLVGDALVVAGVIRDDSQIVVWLPVKAWSSKQARTKVEVFELEDE